VFTPTRLAGYPLPQQHALADYRLALSPLCRYSGKPPMCKPASLPQRGSGFTPLCQAASATIRFHSNPPLRISAFTLQREAAFAVHRLSAYAPPSPSINLLLDISAGAFM
jgi:hypothetical protein